MSVREYKFELTHSGGTTEFYVHDNDAHELMAPPPAITVKEAIERMNLINEISDYLRSHKFVKLEVTKIP